MAVEIIDGCDIEHGGLTSQSVADGIGQSFTGDGRPITSCDFYLHSFISLPTGTVYAKLYAHTGTFGINGKPTGPVLATSKPVSASLAGAEESAINFGFVGVERVTPVNGTKYVITLEHAEDASGNHVFARRTDNVGYLDKHSGNGSYKDPNWIVLPNSVDYIFHVYTGDPSDIVKPVITLIGKSTIGLAVGATYVDAGATAVDNVDGNLTASIVTVNSVNTAVAGTYTVTYNVVDLSGNAAIEVVRTVIVREAVVTARKKTARNLLILMRKGMR